MSYPSPTVTQSTEIEALYLHVPFCFHKCHYCDFYSIVDGSGQSDSARQAPFTDALVAEIRHLAEHDGNTATFSIRPKTIFVGGGTPTLLDVRHWRTLLETLRVSGLLDQVSEFTVEANPETVATPLLETLRAGGVNRISIGGQSFHPNLLHTLERHHDPRSVATAVATARRCAFDNLNLDLIFGIPGQTLAMFQEDVKRALDLEPEHLACYNLTYEPGTALTQRLRDGAIQRSAEADERAMYDWLLDHMPVAAFEHYEISNWAAMDRQGPGTTRGQPDRRCHHNLVYWRNGNWVGAGPSAASHVAGRRWKNVSHLGRYLASAPKAERIDEEVIPETQQAGERLMLGLRLRRGIRLDWLEKALDGGDPRWQRIELLESKGLLQRDDGHLQLTRRGLWVSDAIFTELL